MTAMPALRNAEMLSEIGFIVDTSRFMVMHYPHPSNPKVTLVASERTGERLDLFTQFGSSPLNTPGDPLNICIGIPDHDKSFVEAIALTVVEQFLSQKV